MIGSEEQFVQMIAKYKFCGHSKPINQRNRNKSLLEHPHTDTHAANVVGMFKYAQPSET